MMMLVLTVCSFEGTTEMKNVEWLLCPICKNKTRVQIRKDTELKNFPLFCPKCKQETLITVKDFQIIIIKNTDMKKG